MWEPFFAFLLTRCRLKHKAVGNGSNLQDRCPSALINSAHTPDTPDSMLDQGRVHWAEHKSDQCMSSVSWRRGRIRCPVKLVLSLTRRFSPLKLPTLLVASSD